MFLIAAAVLAVLWLLGFVVFHVAGFFIHILVLLAVIAVVLHFIRRK